MTTIDRASRTPGVPAHSASRPALLAAVASALAATVAPSAALACACGCSAFDVGGIGNLPQEDDHGGRVFTEWYHATQSKNWVGTASASPDANSDKKISTNWVTAGIQYMFNREWGVMAKIPYADRAFTTDTGAGVPTFHSSTWGDAEIMAMYTGFSPTMSTGITVGLKLPTGTYTAANFDRDTQIGSGSTDLLLGAFHRGMITGDNAWQYFGQVRWQIPIATKSSLDQASGTTVSYRPGAEIDGAIGIVYNNGYKVLGFDKAAPLLQIVGIHRERDSGTAADPANTGFDRLLLSPGVEFTMVLDEANKRVLKVYGDVEIPIYTRTNGDGSNKGQGQLVAPVLYKLTASYAF